MGKTPNYNDLDDCTIDDLLGDLVRPNAGQSLTEILQEEGKVMVREHNPGTTPLLPVRGYRHTVCGSHDAEMFNAPNHGAYCPGCGVVVPTDEIEPLTGKNAHVIPEKEF